MLPVSNEIFPIIKIALSCLICLAATITFSIMFIYSFLAGKLSIDHDLLCPVRCQKAPYIESQWVQTMEQTEEAGHSVT